MRKKRRKREVGGGGGCRMAFIYELGRRVALEFI